jgi:hypothetical protein
MSPPSVMALSSEARRYHLATAMMTTALELGREDVELWWSTFLPSFVSSDLLFFYQFSSIQVSWINAIYDAFVAGVGLSFSIAKVRAVEAATVIYLSRMNSEDRNRWWAIQQAINRAHDRNVAQGVSAESVRIDIDLLEQVGIEREKASGDYDVEEQEVDTQLGGAEDGSMDLRGSRASTRAGKARAVSKAEDEDEGEDEDGDQEEIKDTADTSDGAPQEKKHRSYLPYDVERHFYWHKVVRSLSFFHLSVRYRAVCLVPSLFRRQLDLLR